MQNTDELQILRDNFASDWDLLKVLKTKLVDSGQISQADLLHLFAPETNISLWSPKQVALVYQTILNLDRDSLPAPSHFFTPAELEASSALLAEYRKKGDECVFRDCFMISPHKEFGCFVTLNQIYELSQSRELRILSDMQRESELLKYGMVEVPCVKFSMEKMQEISSNWLRGTQHPNTIRFHVLPKAGKNINDCFEYNDTKHVLKIKSGIIANIDGNHRVNAIVDAVSKNKTIGNAYRMGLIISFGPSLIAKEIITQEEERTPIDTEHVQSMKATVGNDIVNKLMADEDLMQIFRFCTTSEQCRAGAGFFVEWRMAEAITESFKLKSNMSPAAKRELVQYLSDFLLQYHYLVEEKHPGYLQNYYQHSEYTMSNEFTVYGIIEIAAEIQNRPDWADWMEEWIGNLDFQKKINQRYVDYKKRARNFVHYRR